MSGKVAKIDLIKNMAVFKDFHWDSVVVEGKNDKKGKVAEFNEINILYGRNYSGKTTLSRIFRAMETGSISDSYASSEFTLSFDDKDKTKVTQSSLGEHGHVIRVFNEDFVKENLRFIVDDDDGHDIKSFAILGEANAKLSEEIKQHKTALGSEEDKYSLIGKMHESEDNFYRATEYYNESSNKLNEKLNNKANNKKTGIKHDKEYGDANYNVTKLRKDIETVSSDSYAHISSEQVDKYRKLLKEEPKKVIQKSVELIQSEYSTFATKAKELVEKKIQASDPIQELLNDAILAKWVSEGREHHEGKRTDCAFCGNDLPADLWGKLDKHFNKESKDLQDSIDELLKDIEVEKKQVPNLLRIQDSDFYSEFTQRLGEVKEQFSDAYCNSLESIIEQLEKRKSYIFEPFTFDDPTSIEQELNASRDLYEKLRDESSQFTKSLDTNQKNAREALRLNEVFKFITDIEYHDRIKTIEALKKTKDEAGEAKDAVEKKVEAQKNKISELEAELKNESKGADEVNKYLNNHFGHIFLSLKAIETPTDEGTPGYRFEVIRNKKKAFNLSEGERSLIAFCYFMAKLGDVATKEERPIIWIDDPISSLDANHIFFVYSLINAEIVGQAGQLFVSTHSLDFLKYLRRVADKGETQYFVINRSDQESTIALMPKHLKDYATEFNYLFEQIYECSLSKEINDANYATSYNFGNNARKFLETYLYYKYPDKGMNKDTLKCFFGNEKSDPALVNRIINESSHLKGAFERGSVPFDAPEITTAAKAILKSIKEKDPDQHSALLKSIGKEEGKASGTTENSTQEA